MTKFEINYILEVITKLNLIKQDKTNEFQYDDVISLLNEIIKYND